MKIFNQTYGILSSHWWGDFYYQQISSRIWPRQKWLTKKIPRGWNDKDSIMEITIFECIKHFVEGENALGKDMCYYEQSQTDPDYPEHQKQFNKEVKINYELVTQKLPELEKQLEEEWEKIPKHTFKKEGVSPFNDGVERDYNKVDKLEAEIYDMKTEIMIWAIKQRNCMWT